MEPSPRVIPIPMAAPVEAGGVGTVEAAEVEVEVAAVEAGVEIDRAGVEVAGAETEVARAEGGVAGAAVEPEVETARAEVEVDGAAVGVAEVAAEETLQRAFSSANPPDRQLKQLEVIRPLRRFASQPPFGQL